MGALVRCFGSRTCLVAAYERISRRKAVSHRHTGQRSSWAEQPPQTTWWPQAMAAWLRGASMHMMQAVSCVVVSAAGGAGGGAGARAGARIWTWAWGSAAAGGDCRSGTGCTGWTDLANALRAASSVALQAWKRWKAAWRSASGLLFLFAA